MKFNITYKAKITVNTECEAETREHAFEQAKDQLHRGCIDFNRGNLNSIAIRAESDSRKMTAVWPASHSSTGTVQKGSGVSAGSNVEGIIRKNDTNLELYDCNEHIIDPGEYYLSDVRRTDCGGYIEVCRWGLDEDVSLYTLSDPMPILKYLEAEDALREEACN